MLAKILRTLPALMIICAFTLACSGGLDNSGNLESESLSRELPDSRLQPAPAPTAAPALPAPAAPAPEVVVVEKIVEVVKEVEVPGETIVVEKEVVKSVEVAPQSMPAAPAAAAPAPAPQMSQSASPPPPRPSSGHRGGQPGATTFRDYERSALTLASVDNVSTFSLDTDRTSFQLALNWARAGYDIEPDSVRSEEWVNAFDYGYDQPTRDDSFAISADIMPHPLDSELLLARVGFQAPELRDDGIPLNVTLVLDASGSMADGNRVQIARVAADRIRTSLRDEDRISVVQFDNQVIHELTVENQHPDSREVIHSLDRLAPGGSTNVQAGLDLGVEIADYMRLKNPGAYNYVILMSDGVANVDATNPFAILESAEDRDASNPLRLITIGVGIANYNDLLLEQLAQHGNGWYRYLNDTEQARSLFSRESWLALAMPFADQTRAQVTWNPEVVESWRIVGYENRVTADRNFTQARKEFAEIPSGAATTVFYEIRPARYPRLGDMVNLGDVELRWVTPMSNDSNRQHAQIAARYDSPSGDVDGALLQFSALVALSADRYSALPHPNARHDASYDLSVLKDDLGALDERIGGLDSYRDFAFVIESMDLESPRTSSGYSR